MHVTPMVPCTSTPATKEPRKWRSMLLCPWVPATILAHQGPVDPCNPVTPRQHRFNRGIIESSGTNGSSVRREQGVELHGLTMGCGERVHTREDRFIKNWLFAYLHLACILFSKETLHK